MKKHLILLILLSFGSLSGCGATTHADAETASLTMKTYTVPAGREKNLTHTLEHVFSMGKNQADVGNAWVAGPGQILVLAPARMQDSIAKSIKEIVSHAGAVAKPQPLRLNAWIVDTYPGKGRNDPNLKTIQPALDAFVKDMGASHFTLDHYFTAVSDTGAATHLTPILNHNLRYTVTSDGNGLLLKFFYAQPAYQHGPFVNMGGQVTTKLGQNLVLGLISKPTTGGKVSTVRQLLVVRIVPANQG